MGLYLISIPSYMMSCFLPKLNSVFINVILYISYFTLLNTSKSLLLFVCLLLSFFFFMFVLYSVISIILSTHLCCYQLYYRILLLLSSEILPLNTMVLYPYESHPYHSCFILSPGY